ncbi:MAG: hypothetical protein GY774_07335 [Planctomycetes bacterium]|nr:hypothetical protein [Planctomycetota bacterium]
MRVSMQLDDTACHQAAQLREDFGLKNNAQAVSVALAITAPLADALVKGECLSICRTKRGTPSLWTHRLS